MNEFTKWFELKVTSEKPEGESVMDRLFRRLDGAYPNKWRANFPTPDAIDNWRVSWAETFEDEKITLEEIAKGLKYCKTKLEWPPSCSEFIKACRPAADSLKAYYEAIAGVQARSTGKAGDWSHSAIYWAAMPLSYDLGQQTYSQVKARWESAYDLQMERGEWPPIPAPTLALPAPGKSELSREKAKHMLEQLGASGILKTSSEHTLWYRKILQRIKDEDKTVTLIQRTFAIDAAKLHGYKS